MQRARFVILMMSFCMALAGAADKKELSCKTQVRALSGAKVSKENSLPGALVVVDEVGPVSYVGIPTHFNGKLRIYDQNSPHDTVGYALKGDQLEILEGPKKIQNVTSVLVRMLPSEKIGRVFWAEFKLSTLLVSEGQASTSAKQKKTSSSIKLKFSGRQDVSALERGLTFYGREFAKPGTIVWVGNTVRSMSPKYLGRIALDAKIPEDLNTGYVRIELVTKKETGIQPIWAIPLLPSEIQQAIEVYRDEILVDWFK